jgi:hypothetical protein
MVPQRTEDHTRNGLAWLHSIPALVGLGLGGIYAIGAASAISQLQSAHLQALQVVALIPIDQILSRGIGAITSTFVVAIPIALLTAAGIFNFEQLRTSKEEEASTKDEHTAPNSDGRDEQPEKIISLPFPISGPIGIALGLVVIFVPTDYLTIFLFGAMAMGASIRIVRNWRIRENRHPWRPAAFLAGYLSFMVVAAAMTAIVRPSPLPQVEMSLHQGDRIQAEFVVLANGTWYLSRPGGDLLAVPASNVKTATLTYHGPEAADSIFNSIRKKLSH